jgi:hypothetical protein
VDTNRSGLVDERGEGADFLGQFVHAHGRGQSPAFAALEGLALVDRSVRWELGLREHQQEALRLGLAPRLGEQVVEVFQGHPVSLIS